MQIADSIYDFLQKYTLDLKDENGLIIPFPECLSNKNSIVPDSNNLFSQKIPKEAITFNELPGPDFDIKEDKFLNSPFFIFNERASLLKFFCDLFDGTNTTTHKFFLIAGNAAVGKSHFNSMLTLILRKHRKRFCLINIKNTAFYEMDKLEYILQESIVWFYDEIRQSIELKVRYNIAFCLAFKNQLTESFLLPLLKLSIKKAHESNKKIIFMQDGINYSNDLKCLFHKIGTDNFSFIILTTTSSDSKLKHLSGPNFGFIMFPLEEMNQTLIKKDDKKILLKSILKITDENEIAMVSSLLSCNLHILSKFKE